MAKSKSSNASQKNVKVSPYYSSQEEKEALINMRDNFEFESDEGLPPSVVLLAGSEGTGKTHTACTMEAFGPVYLLDTEFRGQIVTRKFDKVKRASVRDYKQMVAGVKKIISTYPPPGTIVIDSGSDFQKYAEVEYLMRTKQEKVYPEFNWSNVFAMCSALLNDLRFSGYHIVMTARLKEEYRNDKPTGNMVPRIYSEVPYKSDVVLQFTGTGKKSTKKLLKEGYTGSEEIDLGDTVNLPELLKYYYEQSA